MAIAIDLEWPADTAPGAIPDLVSVAWADSDTSGVLTASHDRERILDLVRDALSTRYVGHNVPGDLVVLLKYCPDLTCYVLDAYDGGRITDTMTREKRIDIAYGQHYRVGGYDLGSVAARRAHRHVDKGDPWRLRYGELAGVPFSEWPEAAARYALLDAEVTWEVYQAQQDYQVCFAAADIDARAHFVLTLMERRGIDVDRAAVDALARDIKAEMRALEAALLEAGLARRAGTKDAPKVSRSVKVCRDLVESLGGGVERTPTGEVCVSAGVLRELGLPDGHPLHAYADLTTLCGSASKNLPKLQFDQITTAYDECVVTGRLASAERKAPKVKGQKRPPTNSTNLQNLPGAPERDARPTRVLLSRFRGCLVPPPGYVFGIVDYVGAELVTFADVETAWFGRSLMGDAIRAGRNLHTDFAEVLLGCEYDPSNPDHKRMRAIAKVYNFGKLGGMGDPKFQTHLARKTGIRLPLTQVKEMTQQWLHKWGVGDYFRRVSSSAVGGTIRLTAPRTGFIRGGMSYSEACNFAFQSTAAIAVKRALYDLFAATLNPDGPLAGAWPCLIVHDEIVMCLPEATAEVGFVAQQRIMTDSFNSICLDVPVSVEGRIARRYGK